MKIKRGVFLLLGTIAMCFYGLMYTWTVFSETVQRDLGCNASQFNTVFSLCLMSYALGGVISGFVYGRVNYRLSMMTASAMIGVGLLGSSLMRDVWYLYGLYGILFGVAGGFSYKTLLTSMLSWYPERPGFASGTLLMGVGLTAFALNVPTSYLIQLAGWRLALRCQGGLALLFSMIAALLVTPCGQLKNVANAGARVNEEDMDYTVGRMLREVRFYDFFLWSVLLLATCTTISGNSAAIARTFGIRPTVAAAFTMIISLFNASGRVFFGVIYDKKGRKLAMRLSMCFYVSGLTTLFAALMTGNLICLGVAFVAIGICFGSVPSIVSTYILKTFGRKHYPENFSVQGTYTFFSSFIGSSLLSVFLTRYDNYLLALRFLLVYAMLAVSAYLILEVLTKRRQLAGGSVL